MEDIKLYKGDCLEIMDDLINQGIKVDMVLTDPPYGTTACKWDSIIPLDKMWERIHKLSNDNTPILLFGSLAATGFGILVIAAGILSMLAVAGGLVDASHILAGGNYTGGPTVEWAKGVGLALTAFTSAIGMLSPGLFEMLFGETLDHKIESIVKIGGALRDVAAVIKGGSYTGGPSKEWSEGVGIALMTFANALNAIKPNVFESLLGDTVDQNIASIIKLGEALPRIGLAVGKDTSMYTGGPDKRWAEGVGGSLAAFAGALEQVKPGFFDRLFGDTLDTQIAGMIQIARALPRIGLAIGSDTSMYQGGLSKEWADGVGKTVLAFAEGIALLEDEIDVVELPDTIKVPKDTTAKLDLFKIINDPDTPDSLLVFSFKPSTDSVKVEFNEETGEVKVLPKYENYTGEVKVEVEVSYT